MDVVGVFNAQDLDELKRRKQGQWKCKYQNWHLRDEICDCVNLIYDKKKNDELNEKMKIYDRDSVSNNPEGAKGIIRDLRKKLNF